MASGLLCAFRDSSTLLMLTLYKYMVRSRLEYCCPLWNPVKIGDIQKLENIQRSFLRRIAGCGQLDYWDRLKKLRIMSYKGGGRDTLSYRSGKYSMATPLMISIWWWALDAVVRSVTCSNLSQCMYLRPMAFLFFPSSNWGLCDRLYLLSPHLSIYFSKYIQIYLEAITTCSYGYIQHY